MGHLDSQLRDQYGPGVGQQLFRVLAYVLNHAEITTHGTENAITMADWLLSDPELEFTDPGQHRRLWESLETFAEKLPDTSDALTAAGAFPHQTGSLGRSPRAGTEGDVAVTQRVFVHQAIKNSAWRGRWKSRKAPRFRGTSADQKSSRTHE